MVAMMTNHLDSQGFEVGILTTGDRNQNSEPVFPIPKSVPVFQLWLADTMDCRKKLRELLLSFGPDVFIVRGASAAYFYMIDAIAGTNIRLILSESYDPASSVRHFPSAGSRLEAFAAADRIHLLAESFSSSLPEYLQERICPISNPVAENAPKACPEGNDGHTKYVINVARIVFSQKAQDVLIKAFAQVARRHTDWKLLLVGDTVNQNDYQATIGLISEFGLDDRVELMGSLPKAEVFQLLATSHIFAFPSLYEGFGIALGEAMNTGLPCIGFSDAPAVNELIHHNQNGLLVGPLGDHTGFAAGLSQLMGSPDLRKSMGRESIKLAQKFRPEIILKKWEELIRETGNLPNSIMSNASEPEQGHLGALWYRLGQEKIFYDQAPSSAQIPQPPPVKANNRVHRILTRILPQASKRRKLAARARWALRSMVKR
jgi:glycosyltransferase involved in cell wall biosynthesis